MKGIIGKVAMGVLLAGALPVSSLFAEGESKALPTLLIKGEVVSVDATDPAATLLKVKDRYGFETPIFLTAETAITQGEAALAASSLASGLSVEVEYNFDVNTAKRHAVSVRAAAPAQPAAEATPAQTPPESPTTAAEPAAIEQPVAAEDAVPAPAEQDAAPSTTQ